MCKPLIVPRIYLERLKDLLATDRRIIIGLVGCPGSGKSTLATALQQAFEDISQIVPMDGFHLTNSELRRLGFENRKGAPHTFDSLGYLELLKRLRRQKSNEIIYAPDFQRNIEEAIAGAIPILPQTSLIITEGNYLLLNDGPWADVASLLDETWYVDVNDDLRTSRLIKRHQIFGRTLMAAQAWINENDEPNAKLIKNTRPRAQCIFNWDKQLTDIQK